jgi:serine/threonine protein kinase
MTPADIDRVFGRGRLRMVTGDHVEVFREQALPGERRRYTKRFLTTSAGDFRQWTEREWRILARLVGHGIKSVPDVVQFDRGSTDRPALVQTYDAGITVDHWATLLPLERDGTVLPSVFSDSAHWWALARHSLIALDAIHDLSLVHLDLKADNICIPAGPTNFDPLVGDRSLHPRFDDITLIDFAFSLVSGERLQSALPIATQRDYAYQSPRLLRALEAGRDGDLAPTRQLDWRCDFFSLAAMLRRYLPEPDDPSSREWTRSGHARACAFVQRLIDAHDADLPTTRPHAELIALAAESMALPNLKRSLERGWNLAIEARSAANAAPTPVTRVALPLLTPVAPLPSPATPILTAARPLLPEAVPSKAPPRTPARPMSVESDSRPKAPARGQRDRQGAGKLWWMAGLAATAAISAPLLGQGWRALRDSAVVNPAPVARIQTARGPTANPGVGGPTVDVATVAPATAAPQHAIAAPAKQAPETAIVEAPTARAPAGLHKPTETTPAVSRVPTPHLAQTGARPGAVHPRPAFASPAAPPQEAAAPAAAVPQSSVEMRVGRAVSAGSKTAAAPARRDVVAAAPHPRDAAVSFPSRQLILFQAQVRARAELQAQARAQTLATTQASASRSTPAQSGDPVAIPWAVSGRSPPRDAAALPAPERRAATGVGGPVPTASLGPGADTTAPVAAVIPSAVRPLASSAPVSAGKESAPAFTDTAAPDYGARAIRLMTHDLPRLAQRAQPVVSRVLAIAGQSTHVVGDAEILDAAALLDRPADDQVSATPVSPGEAQRLDAAARTEYARRGVTTQALTLQVQAFGADPLDPEVAGNLAFLLLRLHPAQPEAARQLAMHALALHGTRFPRGRGEDWTTLAIASALSGRDLDARNAFLVSLAVASNVDRQCRAALDAYVMFGDRLRGAVETVVYDAHASGSSSLSSFCQWPPRWTVSNSSP